MEKRRVIVDDDLSNVKSVLLEQGYEVLGMDALDQNPDAVIVSGMDDNVMNFDNIKTKAPVIEARGMGAREVLSELERRINKLD